MMRTGRPLHALGMLGALIVGWTAERWGQLEREVTAAVARAETVQLAAAAAPSATPAAPRRQLTATAPQRQLAALTPAPVALPAVVPMQARKPAPLRRTPQQRITRAPIAPVPVAIALAEPAPRPAVAAAPVAASPPAPPAFTLATRAYAEAASGQRRAAAQDFAAALTADPAAPNAAAWSAARRALTRRWSGSAYVFERPAGSANPGALPLLGGGQSGAALAFTPDPLARRPFSLTARATTATTTGTDGAEAAFGIGWRVRRGISLNAERLVAIGRGGRNAWTARLSGGGQVQVRRVAVDGYAEAGVVSGSVATGYAAAQARAGYPFAVTPMLTLSPGGGVWSSIERGRTTIDRVDAGPGVRLHWSRARLPVDVSVDYRFKVAGNAAPGSGVAVTLGTGF